MRHDRLDVAFKKNTWHIQEACIAQTRGIICATRFPAVPLSAAAAENRLRPPARPLVPPRQIPEQLACWRRGSDEAAPEDEMRKDSVGLSSFQQRCSNLDADEASTCTTQDCVLIP